MNFLDKGPHIKWGMPQKSLTNFILFFIQCGLAVSFLNFICWPPIDGLFYSIMGDLWGISHPQWGPSCQQSRLWNYRLTLWNPVLGNHAVCYNSDCWNFLHFSFQHFEFLVLNVVEGADDLLQILFSIVFLPFSIKIKYVWKLCLLPKTVLTVLTLFAGFCSDHGHKLWVCGHKWSAPTKPNTPTSSKGCQQPSGVMKSIILDFFITIIIII